jgi:hypothetical protein
VTSSLQALSFLAERAMASRDAPVGRAIAALLLPLTCPRPPGAVKRP